MYTAIVTPEARNRLGLCADEAHHLVRVRRLKTGDLFIGIDGGGGRFICRLERDHDGWWGEALEELGEQGESPLRIVLAQALIKKDRFEWVIQKAAELGVSEIIPLETHRTEVHLRPQGERRRQIRWERILADAVKQCGRSRFPRLRPPTSLSEFCQSDSCEIRIALDEDGDGNIEMASSAAHRPTSCSLLIGPEGGWDEADRKIFRRLQIPCIKLGPRILRSETAPVVALTLLQYAWGDLKQD